MSRILLLLALVSLMAPVGAQTVQTGVGRDNRFAS